MILSKLGRIYVGENQPVRIIGVINMSPESFYQPSIKRSVKEAVKVACKMVEEGAEIIDIGGMSTAPYKETYVSEEVELKRVIPVIKAIKDSLDVTISIDTQRSKVAEEAVKAGAEVINDVSGLKNDQRMARVIADYDVSTIIVAKEIIPTKGDPIHRIREALKESLEICSRSDIDPGKIVIDPGIGFFRHTEWKWYEWDAYVLGNLQRLLTLRLPINVGVSRKSFIGKILNQRNPEERLIGSVVAEAIAVLNGARSIRTHNVNETAQAIKLAEKIRVKRRSFEEFGVQAEELSGQLRKIDLMDFLIGLGVEEKGAEIMSKKGEFKVILLENIPILLSLVLKQEMLSSGGDVAIPKKALFGGEGLVNVVLFGTVAQLEKVIKKLKMMRFNSLRKRNLIDAPEMAEVLSAFI